MHNRSHCVASRTRSRRAFTLVEILIVMGIVGVLSAILLSAFRTVKNRAHQTTCASNLQQIGKALQLYAEDHRSFYPPADFYISSNGTQCVWPERIYPYVRSTALFKCPSHPNGEFRTGCPAPDMISASPEIIHYHGSYALNGMGRPTAMNQVRLRNPSGSVLVMGTNHSGSFSYLGVAGATIGSVEQLRRAGIYPWHSAGDNILFADGHVKWMSLDAMVQKGPDLWLPSGAS